MTIKAIETEYKGYRFRSRLEARWAIFFDACGFKWDYEPEGYEVDGVKYLPDFRLYDAQYPYCEYDKKPFFVEVKGDMDEASRRKISALSEAFPVYVVGSIPFARDKWEYLDAVGNVNAEDWYFYALDFMQGGGGWAALFVDKDGRPSFSNGDEENTTALKEMDIDKTLDALRQARAARFA